MDLQFGIFPPPEADRVSDVVDSVRLADRLGLDLVGLQDHPYQRRFLDTFTLIPHLAAATERISFFPDVANLPLRGPQMIAKATATASRLSGGRVHLGLGAGGLWDVIEAMGGPRRTPAEAVASLEDAIPIIRGLWSEERGLAIGGDVYAVDGVHGGPPPGYPTEIWVGAKGPRMMEVVGTLADGWVPSTPYVPPEQVRDRQDRIDEAATAAGRDPQKIRRIYNIKGTITDGRSAADDDLVGPASKWVDTLARWRTELGMDAFVLMSDLDDPNQIRRFAEEVVPGVREALA